MNYKLSDIADITGGILHGADRTVSDVVTDSRVSIVGGETIFVAMSGVNHDSHRYLDQMVARGVHAFIVECEGVVAIEPYSYIVVENSIKALQLLAAHHRSRFGGTVVGITGSNGKTTIKEWMAQAAPSEVKIFRSPRSYNSQLGVALSILMIEGDEDIALIEAGISQCGEMERLEEMIRPDIGVVTSIGEAHQEGFNSLEEKIQEKMKLFARAHTVIYSSAYPELIPYILYNKNSATQYIDAAETTAGDFDDVASIRNSQIIATLYHTLKLGQPNFDALTPVAMRLELLDGLNDSVVINDTYNSDINSLAIALDSLKSIAVGRPTTIILSDILQSGLDAETLYRRVAEIITRSGVERLIGVGSEISRWAMAFSCETKFYASTEELLANLSAEDFAKRAILLKGNRVSRFEKISHALARQNHTTTLEVNLDAMIHNLNTYRSKLKHGEKLVAMVKASSYGAGEYEVAQLLQHQGIDYLAVAFADEGSRLRDRGITMPIIVLNADDGSFSQMVDMRLEPEIYSYRSLRTFAAAVIARSERDYPIHIKLDTGMHRLGFMAEEVTELIKEINSLKGVVTVASIFSHLATSDMGDEGEAATRRQIREFETMSSQIIDGIGYSALRHIANSAAISAYPEAHFDMCRLGIGLYGFGEEELQIVSTLKSRIVQIREISKGEKIGYGGMGEADRVSRIATIPIGYADGLDRHLGCGAWSVVVGGKRAPIIGRICMDSCMVDITDIEAIKEGDEVVIFSAAHGNTAEDMAHTLGTISYEVLTSVSTRVKRIYLKE